MAISLFKQPVYLKLQQEYETLSKFKPYEGDKLGVKNGLLVISKGGFLQAPKRTIKNLFEGGYNRDSVTVHLEKLAQDTNTFIQKVLVDASCLKDSPLDVKQFYKAVKASLKKIGDLEEAYDRWLSDPPLQLTNKLDSIEKQFLSNKNLLRKAKNALDKSLFVKPPQVINFNAPINFRKLEVKMPKDLTPADVLKLAEGAEKQRMPLWKKVAYFALVSISLSFLFIPLIPLQIIKWTIWNPLEFAIKGTVTTASPMEWLFVNSVRWLSLKIIDDEEVDFVLETYARHLVHDKSFSQAHVDALCKLAKYVNELDCKYIKIGSMDVDELLSFAPASFNLGIGAKEALAEIFKSLKGQLISLKQFESFLKKNKEDLLWIDNPSLPTAEITPDVQQKFGNSTINERKRCAVETLSSKVYGRDKVISLKQFTKIVETLSKESKCSSIEPPSFSSTIPEVVKVLTDNGFKQGALFQFVR